MAHRILHCLRAPVGGLFRHVRDLSIAQAEAGHDVGVICDSTSKDSLTQERLAELAPRLPLGLHQTEMSRSIGRADVGAYRSVRDLAIKLDIGILHGHGAKGGAYARLAARSLAAGKHPVRCIYTPHGGSLHYSPASAKGRVYMAAETWMARHTDAILFESACSSRIYRDRIGDPGCPTLIIPNGLLEQEFTTVQPASDASDFLFIGELRHLKGVDVLLRALAILHKDSASNAAAKASLTVVGDGPDADAFRALASELGIDNNVSFPGAMPARDAFPLGRALVMPSRAESFPYIVLEAAAAGLPLFATSVGGIPEIVAGTSTELLPPDDPAALAAALAEFLVSPAAAADKALQLRQRVAENFTVSTMATSVLAAYDRALESGNSLAQQSHAA